MDKRIEQFQIEINKNRGIDYDRLLKYIEEEDGVRCVDPGATTTDDKPNLRKKFHSKKKKIVEENSFQKDEKKNVETLAIIIK